MNTTEPSGTATSGRRARTVVAVIAGVAAVLGFTAATIGLWANRTIYDSDTFADTIGDALTQPEVTDALATYLTDTALRVVPVQSTLDDVLPNRLQGAAPLVTAKLRSTVHGQFVTLLARPATRSHIVQLTRASHATLVRTIDTGGIANLKLQGNAVTLNLLPVVVDGIDALPSGVVARTLNLPDLAYDGDHAVQVDEVSQATGIDLPPDFGLVTVYRGAAVDQAGIALAETQRGLVVFHRALVGIIVVTVLAAALCLGIAVRRRHALIGLFAGGAIAFFVAGLTVRAAIREAPTLAVDPTNQAVIGAVTRSLSSGLIRLLDIGVIVGVVVAVAVGVITFSSRSARRPV